MQPQTRIGIRLQVIDNQSPGRDNLEAEYICRSEVVPSRWTIGRGTHVLGRRFCCATVRLGLSCRSCGREHYFSLGFTPGRDAKCVCSLLRVLDSWSLGSSFGGLGDTTRRVLAPGARGTLRNCGLIAFLQITSCMLQEAGLAWQSFRNIKCGK